MHLNWKIDIFGAMAKYSLSDPGIVDNWPME